MLKRIAVIRKDTIRKCPFGLPIPLACQNAGTSVLNMQDLEVLDKKKVAATSKANNKIYMRLKTGERCPFADKIAEELEAVHCDFGEGGQGIPDWPIRPSPYYARVFSGLGQTGLFAYPVDFYWDNPEARMLFTGIYSVYASTGEINITKVASEPDPILLDMIKNIAIKFE